MSSTITKTASANTARDAEIQRNQLFDKLSQQQTTRFSVSGPAYARVSQASPSIDGASAASSARLKEVQTQVEEVTKVMKHNVEMVMLRDEKLLGLLDKSEELEASSSRFARMAKRLKNKFWWQNAKTWFILAGVVIIVIGIIVLVVIL
jgi:vesicle-associated membrane protein 2